MFDSTRAKLTAVGAVVLLLVAVVVWFEPQTLFLNTTVDDTLPPVAASPTPVPTTTTVPTTTSVVTESDSTQAPTLATAAPVAEDAVSTDSGAAFPVGEFIGLAHDGSGTAQIVELEDGSYILRFENLDVFNGPDLRVILSPSPITGGAGAYDDGDFLDLGDLKGNKGNQNYEIPAGTDLSKYETVAIWCRRFNVSFNAAEI